jgi:hypothetical protein
MTTTTPFDISQTPSTTDSVQVQFPPSTLTSVAYTNNMISGSIQTDSASTANVTVMKNNFPVNSFVATRFYIVGNAKNDATVELTTFKQGPDDVKGYLTDLKASQLYGELVIEGTDMNTSDKMRLCFLLFTNPLITSGVGSLVNLLQSSSKSQPQNVDFGGAISGALTDAKKTAGVQRSYITYSLDTYTYIISTVPINVNATLIFSNSFNLGASRVSSYAVVNIDDEDTWMECDYVPLGTDQVATMMQIPLGSVSDLDSEQSFRQIILFLVFLVFILAFYFVIPPLYQMFLWKLANNDQNAMCNVMKYLDWGYNLVLGVLWFILLWVGVTSTDTNAPNVLSAGIVIGVMHLITYGTIMVSKYNPNFPFDGRQQRCDQPQQSVRQQQQQYY